MLVAVEVSSPESQHLDPIRIPLFEEGPYSINFIDGLDPVDGELVNARYAGHNRGYNQSSSIGERNIVLTLDLVPSYADGETVEDLRTRLYQYMGPTKKVDLSFEMDDGRIRRIQGFGESFTSPLFVSDPGVQVSIVCPNPFFTGDKVQVSKTAVYSDPIVVVNEGSLPIPFKITVKPSGTSSEIGLEVTNGSYFFDMPISKGATNAAMMVLDSTPGSKNLRIGGVVSFDLMVPPIRWPYLQPGKNEIWPVGGGSTYTADIEYTPEYIGL